MRWYKLIIGFSLTLFVLTVSAQKRSKVKIKVIIEMKSVEDFRKPLKNTLNYIYLDGIIIDSVFCLKNSMTYLLSPGHIYKIEFTKAEHVSKHVIINTIEVPNKKRKYIKLKADINLFKIKPNKNIDFLKSEPVSIAYYNHLKKTLVWDYDYNRSVVEKIIHACLKK